MKNLIIVLLSLISFTAFTVAQSPVAGSLPGRQNLGDCGCTGPGAWTNPANTWGVTFTNIVPIQGNPGLVQVNYKTTNGDTGTATGTAGSEPGTVSELNEQSASNGNSWHISGGQPRWTKKGWPDGTSQKMKKVEKEDGGDSKEEIS